MKTIPQTTELVNLGGSASAAAFNLMWPTMYNVYEYLRGGINNTKYLLVESFHLNGDPPFIGRIQPKVIFFYLCFPFPKE